VGIPKESISLIDEHGMNYRPVSGGSMAASFKRNPIVRFLAGSVVSVVIGAASCVSTILANRHMEADWRKKEIPDNLILQPGTQMNGFVYFKVPQDRVTTLSKLCLLSEKLSSGETFQLQLIPGENGSAISFSPVQKKKTVKQASTEANR